MKPVVKNLFPIIQRAKSNRVIIHGSSLTINVKGIEDNSLLFQMM